MKLRLLSAADLDRALPMEELIKVMKETFEDFSNSDSEVPQRLALTTPEPKGVTLVKPARTPRGLGAKLVSVFSGNRDLGLPVTPGLVVQLDASTGMPAAILDGTRLTTLRTGAATGAATDLLARRDSRIGALFGSGLQAETQLLALDVVRSLDEIRVYSPDRANLERFVGRMQPSVRASLVASRSAELALEGGDIVIAATSSHVPVFDGRLLAPGAHVNGIGSFNASMLEIDIATIDRARIFVDSREAAGSEAGELIDACRRGKMEPASWTELGEVVARRLPGRLDDQEITFFKSVGLACQDVDAAAYALEKAEDLGLGRSVEL